MSDVLDEISIPEPGQIVRVRSRAHLVESVEKAPGYGTLVRVACLEDDAQGQQAEVVWELELGTEILGRDVWKRIGERGFDDPRHFAAFINTIRWNCVTATDPALFQAPFRAGIKIDAYQLEPLRKALRLPRVNLFIADDTGVGKTIEAGLIATELLLRRRVREIIVACPPSMIPQWRDEMESRFGLTFEVLDRVYIERMRQERGYGVNPWATYPRLLVSHNLLIDEAYAAPLRDWLDNLRPGSLLILDEAHHAAPASGARYAIDSRITRAVRDLAGRFEHRLFLSATPHNGHSNSFSALLEILDSQRFTRGVKVLKSNLDAVMVRRLKEDLREIGGGFPVRKTPQIDLGGLPEDAPELKLSRLLNEYRDVRQLRMSGETKKKQAQAALLISGLQQRLLSSIEAFARTLAVHRRTMERIWTSEQVEATPKTRDTSPSAELLSGGFAADDERSELSEKEQAEIEDAAIESVTASTGGNMATANVDRERQLLDQMEDLANQARWLPDARIRYLVNWMRDNMCKGIHAPGTSASKPGASWNDTRILIFTEYEDTKRYVVEMLRQAIAGTDLAEHRIEVFHGPTPPDKRDAIKKAFNASPAEHPIRILVATDAAREGLNLQAHCHNLFHIDVPWNPGRLEQRNGRIDRKLQPAPEVYCHYFVYPQRPEDRILKALVRKTETIRRELGSLSKVLEARLSETLKQGIRHQDIEQMEKAIEGADSEKSAQEVVEEELEAARERQQDLQKNVDVLRRHLNTAREYIGFDADQFRDALSCSLELLGAKPLQPVTAGSGGPQSFKFPDLDLRLGKDPSWSGTLDTLRELPKDGHKDFAWKRESPIRPVVFTAPEGIDDEVVQLHLEHRISQRLLSRFLSQGFVYHDLSRACLAQTDDAIPRVIMLGRLSLYGTGAVRLHEEIVTVTARWVDPTNRKGELSPYGREAESKTLDLLRRALAPGRQGNVPEAMAKRLQESIAQDIEQLLPHLEQRGEMARSDAEKKLLDRGRIESDAMRKVLEDQRKRVQAELGEKSASTQLELTLMPEEKKQLESNRRYWQRWLANVDGDLQREPARIMEFYQTASHRIEPVGLAYLWPVTN